MMLEYSIIEFELAIRSGVTATVGEHICTDDEIYLLEIVTTLDLGTESESNYQISVFLYVIQGSIPTLSNRVITFHRKS